MRSISFCDTSGSIDFLASPACLVACQKRSWRFGKASAWCGLKKSVHNTERWCFTSSARSSLMEMHRARKTSSSEA